VCGTRGSALTWSACACVGPQGLRWMMGLAQAGLNGILADEMGLGKTVQVRRVLGLLLQRSRAASAICKPDPRVCGGMGVVWAHHLLCIAPLEQHCTPGAALHPWSSPC
jgi:hypothetical protein